MRMKKKKFQEVLDKLDKKEDYSGGPRLIFERPSKRSSGMTEGIMLVDFVAMCIIGSELLCGFALVIYTLIKKYT